MALVSYAVRIDVRCPTCAVPVSVAGDIGQVSCPGCGKVIALGGDFLQQALAEQIDRRRKLVPPGFNGYATWCGSLRVRTAFGRDAPCCDNPACGRELPLSLFEGAQPATRPIDEITIVCPACQTSVVVRRRVPSVIMGHEQVRGLLLQHRAAPRLTGPEGGGVICVWCSRGGCPDAAGLDEYQPAITCNTCDATSPLARAHWDRMTALPGAKYFYILIEETQPAAAQRRTGGPASGAASSNKQRVEPFVPTSFPLSLGWVFSMALLVPAISLVMILAPLAALGPHTSMPQVAAVVTVAVLVVLALMIGLRLPGVVRTLVSDRCVVLGEDALHVPVITLFQRRPWNLPFRDLASISDMRKSGGSTKLVIALRDGRTHVFSAAVVQDRYALIKAVDRRIPSLFPGDDDER